MLFNIDRFYKKQEELEAGLDGWSEVSELCEKLTPEKKNKFFKEIKQLEEKADLLKSEKCNCVHIDSKYDFGLDHTCAYHEVLFQIKLIKNELESYRLDEYRESYIINKQIEKELKIRKILKILPFIVVALIVFFFTIFLIVR